MIAFPSVVAQPLFVSITAEGNVEGTSAIQRNGNIYTLTSNLEQASIVIEASNIVLDGAGFTLQGEIYKINGDNVEIKNLKIDSQATAIEIYGSNCKITSNEIQAEYGGIRIRNTNNHIISGNKIDAKVEAGIAFGSSSYNIVTENTIATSIMVGGVDLSRSDHNTFSRNTLHFVSLYHSSHNIFDQNNLPQGISLRSSSNYNKITENSIKDFNKLTETNFMSSGSIKLNGCEGNIVSSNTISNSGGIFLDTSSNNTLRNNSVSGAGKSFEVSVSPQPSVSSFINDIDDSNTINGKKIYYLIDKSDLSINPSTYPNIGYLALVNCKRITVENNHLNSQGMLLAWTTDSLITNNDISNNYGDGVTLTYALRNKIMNNNVDSNRGTGIALSYSNQTIISGNHITRNQIGISLIHSTENSTISENNITDQDVGISFQSSSSNLIYRNNFVNNTKQVYDVGWEGIGQPFPGIPLPSKNIWENDSPAGGNYWSDYSGMETYVIDENNVDHYPQAQQITFSALAPTPTPSVPEFSSLSILLLVLVATVISLLLCRRHRKIISQNKPDD
jgi:parallel beta-helix repeat protein